MDWLKIGRLRALIVILGVLALHAAWQLPGLVHGGFQNQDVAGIAYNARLLLAGKLPYIDSFEFKSPLAFLLFAPLLALGSMRWVWALSILWGAAVSLAVGLLAARCWNPRVGAAAALLHAAGARAASLGDINYSFWMVLPFTLAAALVAGGWAEKQLSRRRWLAVGALLAAAVLFKHTAVTLVLVVALPLCRELWRRRWSAAGQLALWIGLGGFAVLVLVSLPFAVRGHPFALVTSQREAGKFASGYLASMCGASGGVLPALFGGFGCIIGRVPIAVALAVAGALPIRRKPPEERAAATVAVAFLVAACIGLALTLRFYPHDVTQLWPALVLWSVRPGGALVLMFDWLTTRSLHLPAAAALGLISAATSWKDVTGIQDFLLSQDSEVQSVCRPLQSRLPPSQPVLGWGWNAWSVYEHCHRFAPGRFYKALGSVTTDNTNTCSDSMGGPIRLRPGAAATDYLRALRDNPPSLIILSSYYRMMGDHQDPLQSWTPAHRFIQQHYLVVRVHGGFVTLVRKDLIAGR